MASTDGRHRNDRAATFPARDVIRRELAHRPYPTLDAAERSAAVLVCLHAEEILLVRRRIDPRDRWSGHIGLPGGRHEDVDEDLLATALRETHEELGFHAADDGHVLGALGTYLARHRQPDDLAIGVFVAEFVDRPALTLSDEIAAAHWVGLAALERTRVSVPEEEEPVPACRPVLDQGELLGWGITYGILERLRTLA
ncbi:MAG: NUDIX hydrolase [Gaiellaceae bacterium]